MRPEPVIAIEGIGALHRVDDSDCARVLAWRNAPAVRAAMYTTHEISPREHEVGWAAKVADPGTRYCIAQGPDGPLGVVAFTQLDTVAGTAQWALYAVPDAPRGAGGRMGALSMEVAFGRWALSRLGCEVRVENTRARALYDRLGFSLAGALQHETADGEADAVRLEIIAEEWRTRRAAFLTALRHSGDAT